MKRNILLLLVVFAIVITAIPRVISAAETDLVLRSGSTLSLYEKDGKLFLLGAASYTTASEIKDNFANRSTVIVSKDSVSLSGNDSVSTGTEVTLSVSGNAVQTAYIVVAGDVTGDGEVTALDYLYARNECAFSNMDKNSIKYLASDVDGDGTVTNNDFELIKSHVKFEEELYSFSNDNIDFSEFLPEDDSVTVGSVFTYNTENYGGTDEHWNWQYQPVSTGEFFDMTYTYVENYSKDMYAAGWETYPYSYVDQLGSKLHPALEANTVKTFTVPESGTVDIDTSVYRAVQYEAASAGTDTPTSLRVLHNETQIFPPQGDFMMVTDTEAFDFTLEAEVNKGDTIRFIVGAIDDASSDAVFMSNTVTYTRVGETVKSLGEVFEYVATSETFSTDIPNWSFEYRTAGTTDFKPMTFAYVDRYSREMYVADWENHPYSYVDKLGQKYHPGLNADTVKTFTAPYSGTITLSNSIRRENEVTDTTNGNSFAVYVDETKVYPATKDYVEITSVEPVNIEVTVTVKEGSKIRIVIGSMGNKTNDAVRMTNKYTYTSYGIENGYVGDAYTYSPATSTEFLTDDPRWSFEYCTAGGTDFKPMTVAFVDRYSREMYVAGWETYPYSYVDALGKKYHPALEADTVKTFTVPYSGVINLNTVVKRYVEYDSTSASATPTTLRILLNDMQVYPTGRGETGISLTSTTAQSFDVSINVLKGDKVRVVVGSDGNCNSDALNMQNTVTYKHVGQMNLVAVPDHKIKKLVVYDISTGGLDLPGAEIWSWSPSSEFTCVGSSQKYDELKLVYSTFYKGFVVLTTSSDGFCAIIDYATGGKIWEVMAASLSPHSIELLPNGNVVIANSNGNVRIYKSSQGSTDYVETELSSAHGVIWDTELKVLWALGYNTICSYKIGGTAANPTFTLSTSTALPTNGGHDLAVDYADSNSLLFTTSHGAYKFNKTTKEITNSYVGSEVLSRKKIKGFSNCVGESSNIFVRSIAKGTFYSYSTDTVEVIILSTYQDQPVIYGKMLKTTQAAYYKVRTWNALKR